MNSLVFDIETIPDVEACRKIHDLHDLDDIDVVNAVYAMRRQDVGHEFLPLYLHRVVAISVVLRYQNKINVWSLGEQDAQEREIIERFFEGIARYEPRLVSWNGSGFDLPVLHYRAMLHKITASKYWEQGETVSTFKWNNYINRYHERHTDVMDVVALFNSRNYAPLDHIATMFGYPGKMGMDGSKVYQAYSEGNIKSIRDYCETDVLNTHLVYLRFLLMKGELSQGAFEQEEALLANHLENAQESHLLEFLEQWKKSGFRKDI
jgi:predicted PolB exonuclease-like 3'-5' exonuclease